MNFAFFCSHGAGYVSIFFTLFRELFFPVKRGQPRVMGYSSHIQPINSLSINPQKILRKSLTASTF